jgi:sulfite exporter TauE/SafE
MTSLLAFGFLLGVRHALDVDHLAAVSTILGQRRGLVRSALVGAVWGLGHTAALLAVAVVVIALHAEIPPAVAHVLELGVAVMLVGLGLNLLRVLWRGGAVHVHAHEHGGHVHLHPHVHAESHAPGHRTDHDHAPIGRRPFLVGAVHGLAGSAGLMLAVAATIREPAWALAYVGIFGVGSVGGMMLMSTLLGLPLALAARRFARVEAGLRVCAAIASVVVGVALGWEIGVEAGWIA